MSQEPDFNFDNTVGEDPNQMEMCQVTGKLTPYDEIVELHGYRVCAEGKQEILRRLKAGLSLPGEMETPGIGTRFVAMLLDSMILGTFAMIGAAILGYNLYVNPMFVDYAIDQGDSAIWMFKFQGALTLGFYMISSAYFIIFHARGGQTPGKMAAGIMVVDYDGAPITYKRSTVRLLYYQGPYFLAPFSMLILWEMEMITIVNLALSSLGALWGLVDIVMALADRAEQKSLHDRLAATRVIVKG